jgi:hypothetical protein
MKLDHRIREPIALGTCVRRMDQLAPDLLRNTRPAGAATAWIDPTPAFRVPWEPSE